MKVSIIEPIGGHGGLDFYNLGLSESLAKEKYKVYLYTSNDTKLDGEIHEIQTIVKKYYKNIFETKVSKYIRGLKYIFGTLLSLIDSKRNDVKIAHFHIYNFSFLELFNLNIFKVFGFKIIVTIHDIDHLSDVNKKHSDKKIKKFKNVIDKVIVHTDFTKRSLLKYFDGFESRIFTVPHGDIDFIYNIKISKQEALKKLKLDTISDIKIILLFGQIKKVKGLDILLKAFAKIKDNHKDTIVLVAGKLWKNEEDEYIKIIEENLMQDQVVMNLKFIDNKDVPLYFKAADIVALPYKKIYNSGVILRALDYESTVLVSDLEPLTKVIQHGENGFVFKSENIDDMAKKIDILLGDAELRERLKESAKRFIENNFSWEQVAKKTIEVYEFRDKEN
jgi:D-inositol-3-phosphate glycosyltransferase